MTKAIISCLAILVLSSAAAEAAAEASSSSSPVASMPPMSQVESGRSTPPAATAESRKLMGGSGGGQAVGSAEIFLRGCVPKELCSKNELLCFRVCTAGVEEQHREQCPFKCVKCAPTC